MLSYDYSHQLVDDASAYLLINLLRDAVDGLVGCSAGDLFDLVMSKQYGLPAFLFYHIFFLIEYQLTEIPEACLPPTVISTRTSSV